MIFHLFRRPPREATIARLYGMIVAQARAPAFYRDYGVPDTVNGRFEMVVLHAVMVLRQLDTGAGLQPLGQAIFDRFCLDMDDHLREMGVGDLAVPRKMRKIGEAFYSRQRAYATALAPADDEAIMAAVARSVFGAEMDMPEGARRLAAYVRAAEIQLSALDADGLSRAEAAFPDPAQVPDMRRQHESGHP